MLVLLSSTSRFRSKPVEFLKRSSPKLLHKTKAGGL